ncbi:MAG: VCBS repeat-containing protein, partial [Bacteroidota bacterium]|nr:VCBS repeat-containing protein [Bacteroidota bacterium]
MKKILFVFFCIIITHHTFTQDLHRDTTIIVKEGIIKYSKAWSGGINNAQFSEIDLNLDGEKDLVIFDRTGNKLTPFIYNNGEYIFAPIYRNFFPKLHDWVILADYNCDGKNDIYTYSTGGFAIYKNTS